MSFVVRVEVVGLTWEQAEEPVEAGADPHGLVLYRSRRPRFFGRSDSPELFISDYHEGRQILSADADWDAPTWSMERDLLPRLATTLRCLCRQLPDGFTFIAGWIGDEEHDRELNCDEVVDLAERSALNPKTRYLVLPTATPE